MNDRDLAILAIKEEAQRKPKERFIAGELVLTFEQVVERIEDGDKRVIKLVLEPYQESLKQPEFRANILKMLGIKE